MAKTKDTIGLGRFDGRDVLNTGVAIRNAGDGLSKALGVDPVQLHMGEKVYVVLECEVGPINHAPIKDTKGVERVHVLKAGSATMVDETLVRSVLDEQEKRIEQAQGIERLPFDTGGLDDDSLAIDAVAMDPDKASTPKLRGWLKAHDLPSAGTKPDLVGRVNDWWRQRAADNAAGDEKDGD